jgi:hypothetical protein
LRKARRRGHTRAVVGRTKASPTWKNTAICALPN